MTGALEMDLLDPNLPPDDPLTFLDVLHAREGRLALPSGTLPSKVFSTLSRARSRSLKSADASPNRKLSPLKAQRRTG